MAFSAEERPTETEWEAVVFARRRSAAKLWRAAGGRAAKE